MGGLPYLGGASISQEPPHSCHCHRRSWSGPGESSESTLVQTPSVLPHHSLAIFHSEKGFGLGLTLPHFLASRLTAFPQGGELSQFIRRRWSCFCSSERTIISSPVPRSSGKRCFVSPEGAAQLPSLSTSCLSPDRDSSRWILGCAVTREEGCVPTR